MSFNKLIKTIDNVEKKPVPGIFNISDLLLPENEIVKNILIMENNLSKEEAELLVEGFVKEGDNRKKSQPQIEIENLKSEADTNFKNKLIEDSVSESIGLLSETDTGAPLSTNTPHYKRARETRSLIREKVNNFFRKVKELLKEIAVLAISIVTSVPGASLMVSPFAFNVPGMITMLMNMVHSLSILSSKTSDLTENFKYFRELPLVLSPTDLNKVSTVILTSYQGVTKAFKPLEKSIENYNKVFKNNLKKIDNTKIAKKVTSRLRKLKYIEWSLPPFGQPPFNSYTIRGIENVNEDDKDEVEDILENWEVIFLTNFKVAVKRKKLLSYDGKEIDIEKIIEDIDNIEKIIDLININLPDMSNEDDFIYDVRFSDGRNLFGITRIEVEGLESTYNVIYSQNVKYSFI